MKTQASRWKININGKWAGGSFTKEEEAKAAAAKLPRPNGEKIEVVPKGEALQKGK